MDKKPLFSTLCHQAQEVLNKKRTDLETEINSLQDNIRKLDSLNGKAADFVASGMSFRLYNNKNSDEFNSSVLDDTSGQNLRNFIVRYIPDSNDKTVLVAAMDSDLQLAHKFFCLGYKYETLILKGETRPACPATTTSVKMPSSSEGIIGSLEIIQGDITKLPKVDVIVNAANENLWAGSGVCGCIHKAAGPMLEAECMKIGHCDTGCCVMTDAYNLPNKKVIHAVGPRWRGGTHGETDLLASCYKKAIQMAFSNEYNSIAFPFISSGIFGYPNEECAEVALTAIREAIETTSIKVTMVAYEDNDYTLLSKTLQEIQ